MAASLLEFALVNDAVAANASKLKKQELLAIYFRSLEDDDLRRAIRFASGRTFSATDERVLNVGWRIASDVVLSLVNIAPGEFNNLIVKSGELGEALSHIWQTKEVTPPLSLGNLATAFEALAAVSGGQRKREILTDLFTHCGHPREATYLAKIIFGDLRTGVQDGVLQAAIATAFEKPLGEIRRCHLLVGDLGEVAILARHDRLAEAEFTLFHPIQFMLAEPQPTPADIARRLAGRVFYLEDKLDGIRAQIHKSGDRVAIYTRTMDRTDESFPEVVAAMRELPGDFLLDGEIVPWRDGCVMPFAHLQKRLGRKVVSAKMLRDNPVAFIAFDMLYHDGRLLMNEPLRERRAALASLQPPLISHASEVSKAEEIELAFAAARERRNEGIVLKDPESIYAPGRRGQADGGKRGAFSGWLKLKTTLPSVDCVVTAAEYGNGRRRAVLSDYTFAVWSANPREDGGAELLNVGKAYNGLTDKEIAELTEVFLGLSIAQHGRVHLVQPKIVLEITFDQIQKSARHSSGYAFRFPRIKRIRTDKTPEDADTLGRVAELYESTHNFGRTAAVEEPQEPTLFD